MNKVIVVGGVVLVVVIGGLFMRKAARQEQLEQERVQLEREVRQHIDLSALPPIAEKVEEKPAPKFKKKPVIVELELKQKKGKGTGPFKGHYQVLDAGGGVISEDDASGEPATLILTPGHYELVVPAKKFRQPLTILGDEEKTALSFIIAK